jgi:hypothetical protein
MTRFIDAASALLIVGLLVSLIGAAWAAKAVIIDENTAAQLSATKWNGNDALRQALLDQSRAARDGLILIGLGSVIQIAGVVWPLIEAMGKR